MSISVILEVAIGMVTIYYVMSLVVSYATAKVEQFINLRAETLLNEVQEALGQDVYNKFVEDPAIKQLKPKNRKLLRGGVDEGGMHEIDHIPPETFASSLLRTVAPQEMTKLASTTGNDTEIKAQVSDIVNNLKTTLSKDQSLPEEIKKRLLEAINASDDNVEKMVSNVAIAFDSIVSKVSGIYKKNITWIALLVATALTAISGIDSIAVVQGLWQQPTARAAADAQVQSIVTMAASDAQTLKGIQADIASLDTLQIPLFWWSPNNGLPTDFGGVIVKILGLGITAIAASRGSSFWFDVLRKIRTQPSST